MTISEFAQRSDPTNLFSVLVDSYQQIEHAWAQESDLSSLRKKKFQNIVISGMGGSAIAGNFLVNFLQDEIKAPVTINRNYFLPPFASKDTLLIVSSYSGNTEESLSVFRQGLQAGCSIVCITTGGTAANIAKENDLPVFPLRSGYQPRYAFGASFFSLLKVFQLAGLINDQSATVQRVIDIWKKRGEEFTRENNFAYQMARQLIGFVPVIIAVADVNESLAVRMKSQFNENSKMHAFASIFPEHNHNEIIAWETFAPDQMNAATILFNDPDYHPQVKKRIEIVMKLIEKAGCPIITLSSLEKDHKTRMCELIYLGDWITYYSAILRGKDPGEIDYIHYLKNRLAE